jgi:hypothetical protein
VLDSHIPLPLFQWSPPEELFILFLLSPHRTTPTANLVATSCTIAKALVTLDKQHQHQYVQLLLLHADTFGPKLRFKAKASFASKVSIVTASLFVLLRSISAVSTHNQNLKNWTM